MGLANGPVPFSSPGGWAFGASHILVQSVRLAGNARRITRIDVQLWGHGSDQFWIRLYDLSGLTAIPPGVSWDSDPKVIWESPLQSFGATPPFGSRIISVSVPGIQVPDTLAWAVAPLEQRTTNLIIPAVLPPQVGTRTGVVVRQLDGNWATAISDWTFGARLIAVPEQSSGALAAVAVGVAICSIRRHALGSLPGSLVWRVEHAHSDEGMPHGAQIDASKSKNRSRMRECDSLTRPARRPDRLGCRGRASCFAGCRG
jgi:hypothetical protein